MIVVGNGEVGKTSMIRRFCTGSYTDGYKKTIGVDFLEREFFLRSAGQEVKMMLWDTAGQEEYDAITRTYYRGAAACVFVFSTTDAASLRALPRWYEKVVNECGQDMAMVLVQNKVDLIDDARVTAQEAEDMADSLKVKLYRSCVKEDVNVSEVFESLASRALEIERRGQAAAAAATGAGPATERAGRSASGESAAGPGSASSSAPGQDAAPRGGEDEADAAGAAGAHASNGGAGAVVDFNRPSKQRTKGKKSRACSLH